MYNGGNFTISGLTVNRPSGSFGGLFGYVSGSAQFRNLGMINVSISSDLYSGGIIALTDGTGTRVIENVYSTGVVSSGRTAGGIIGACGSCQINNSYSRSSATGNEYGESGGLVGSMYNTSTSVTNSYSTGAVSGTTAGIYATKQGGLIGSNSNGTVTNSFYDSQTSGKSDNVGKGVPKTTAEMKTQSTFTDASWDFPSTWTFCSSLNNGYPILTSFTGEITSVVPIGAGTSLSPYQIATLANLKWITESSTRWTSHYIQTAHINATATANWNCGAGWLPIGTAFSTSFTGSYNGNGFTISNITVNRPSSDNIGLFGYTRNASIQKLALVDSKIAGYSYVGALIGRMSGGSLTNSYSQGNASVTSSWSYTGGLVGYATGSITNSYSQGQVTSSSIYVGGVVGATRELVISKSYSSSTVTGSSSVGGLVGWSTFETNISNTYASGDVKSTVTNSSSFSYTGGLVGNVSSAIPIVNSYSVSKVTAIGLQVGGLVGYTAETVTNSFYDSETSGRSDTGKGVPKTTAEMKTQSTFTTWDFTASTGVWNINPTGYISYPYLQAIPYDVPDASPAVNPIPGLAAGPTDYTWTGGTGDGGNASNWSGGMPPAGSDIVIPEGATPYPVFAANMALGNITIEPNATLTMAPSFRLNITEDSNITIGAGGKLILKSDGTGTAYIGSLTGTSAISGTVLQERYIMGSNRSFRFMGHPFSAAIPLSALGDKIDITGPGAGFTPSSTNSPSAFYYDPSTGDADTENDGGWKAFTAMNDSWEQYQGIRVLVRDSKGQSGSFDDIEYTPDPVTFEWEGAVNTGPQTIDLGFHSPSGGVSDFNLIGNPFPSAIDLKAITRSASVGGSFYTWQPRESSSGMAGRGGAYWTEPFTSNPTSYALPTGGAFFVRAGAAGQSLIIEEANKTNANEPLQNVAGSTLRMDSNVASKYGSNSIQLVLSSEGEWWDRSLIFFNGNTTSTSEDKEDATKMANPEVNFFTVSADDFAMAIDARPYQEAKGAETETNNNRIPLHILSPARAYILSLPDFDMEEGRTLRLYDRFTEQYITLQKGTSYDFEVTADPKSKGHRFDIVMGIEVITSIHPSNSRFQAFILPNPAQQQVRISIQKPDNIATTHIRIVSMTGLEISNEKLTAETAELDINVGQLSKGIYLVEITHGTERIVKRLIVN